MLSIQLAKLVWDSFIHLFIGITLRCGDDANDQVWRFTVVVGSTLTSTMSDRGLSPNGGDIQSCLTGISRG
ncbi:MAG: hypothetical protein KJ077_14100 [Anaerolineae bacterium]|nr:hypothetical protein [Anaerolineae bacterium]